MSIARTSGQVEAGLSTADINQLLPQTEAVEARPNSQQANPAPSMTRTSKCYNLVALAQQSERAPDVNVVVDAAPKSPRPK